MSDRPNDRFIKPEIELMLHCARTRVQPWRANRMRSLVRDGVDWNLQMETAARHRVLPLLCWNLSRWCAAELPAEIAPVLRAQSTATLGRNLGLTAQLFKILNVLLSKGIHAVPFKGPSLAMSVYGNLAFREFGDLDILVRRRDVPAAREALLSIGLAQYRQLSARGDELHIQHESAMEYLGDNGLVVELHWELTSWRSLLPLDPETLWNRLEPVTIAGRAAYTLPAHDLFLYLCAHGAKHQWQRLQWVCDIAEFSQAKNWPWTEILNRAASLGVRRMALVAFSLAEILLEVDFPPEVQEHIQADRVAQTLAIQCSENMLQARSETATSQLEFFCAANERVRDKARYLVGRVWANAVWGDKDTAFVRLPRWLQFLYYAVKPVRVLRERTTGQGRSLASVSGRRS